MFSKFRVGDLFDIHPTNAYKMSNSDLFRDAGSTPVLSNSSVNNGIGGYSGLDPTEKGGIITFSDTTTGGDTMFYQANDFIGYPHVQGMYPLVDGEWNEKSCLYIISAIRKAAGKGWSYAVKFNRTLVKELMIELPVIKNPSPEHIYTINDIDWSYMQNQILGLENGGFQRLNAYFTTIKLLDSSLTKEEKNALSLSTKKLSEEDSCETDDNVILLKKFTLGDLFTAETGDVDLQQKDINGKGTYFVNSGVDNRGIKGRTDKKAKIFPSNTITIDFWGNAYYRDFEYKMATHNHVFSLSGKVIKNLEVGLYIVGSLSKLPKLFSYNNMAPWPRLKEIPIYLPVTKDGEFNYTYMELYIRAIKKIVVKDGLKFKDKALKANSNSNTVKR